MLRRNTNLLAGSNLPANIICKDLQIPHNNEAFVQELITQRGQLPQNPPFEVHPYKEDLELLGSQKYVIGTFPPISYMLDYPEMINKNINVLVQPFGGNNISKPDIPFYHGNMGSMWNYLLTDNELAELSNILNMPTGRLDAKNYLRGLLNTQQINYADIIDSMQRELNNGKYTASDDKLHNICVNTNLICHILNNPQAKYLLFNTGSIFKNNNNNFLGINTISAFDLFINGCISYGLDIHIKFINSDDNWLPINNLNLQQRSNKLVFDLKLGYDENKSILPCLFKSSFEKELRVITPFSPAAANRGRTRSNNIVRSWMALNNALPPVLLKDIYQNFRNGNIEAIQDFNL